MGRSRGSLGLSDTCSVGAVALQPGRTAGRDLFDLSDARVHVEEKTLPTFLMDDAFLPLERGRAHERASHPFSVTQSVRSMRSRNWKHLPACTGHGTEHSDDHLDGCDADDLDGRHLDGPDADDVLRGGGRFILLSSTTSSLARST